MRWGIIGTGNMGSMLTASLVKSGAVRGNQLTIYNRTKAKAENLKEELGSITVADTLQDIQQNSDILFICVKPHHYKGILEELEGKWKKEQCLVSITSPIAVEQLEKAVPCEVARVVPSITNHALAGVSLMTFSENTSEPFRTAIHRAFSHISTPVEIEEEYIRAASDIVSCGPAFISFLLSQWIAAAGEVAGMPKEKATVLTENMMTGLGELLSRRIMTLEELMEKVTVKGGVTGEGLQALEDHIGPLFQKMFEATQRKHKEDKTNIHL
ncbi:MULTISPECIES: late competence protein ComER [Halobacillus]|uniref:late competence protein ComER n=1 Tax=Halobacillus TaxID=45667 RepID=UPI00136E8F55|nr:MULTISPECIES: late competence protein ComER [Halobacillus]MYL28987.1 late competence protein ComER [Halobacillus halophilus]MYL37238.1 late competence protein ComER [Halobacillus litoralis]